MKTSANKRVFMIFLAFAVLLRVGACANENAPAAKTPADMEKLLAAYEYDHKMPLNTATEPVGEYETYTAWHIAFDSINGERVPGLIFIPKDGKPTHPVVIAQHGYGGDKTMGAMFAPALAQDGIALIAIDAEFHGERREAGKDALGLDPAMDELAFRQSIIDISRAIDYLELRGDIDMSRVGYIGISMGSFFGGVVAGVDKRISTAALIIGGGGWEEFLNDSMVGPIIKVRENYKATGKSLSEFAEKMRTVEPAAFIGRFAPRPLLMLNCSNDKIVPKKNAEILFAAAGEPKYIEWFTCEEPTGHIPPMGKTQNKVKKWFGKQFLEK